MESLCKTNELSNVLIVIIIQNILELLYSFNQNVFVDDSEGEAYLGDDHVHGYDDDDDDDEEMEPVETEQVNLLQYSFTHALEVVLKLSMASNRAFTIETTLMD